MSIALSGADRGATGAASGGTGACGGGATAAPFAGADAGGMAGGGASLGGLPRFLRFCCVAMSQNRVLPGGEAARESSILHYRSLPHG